MYSLTFVRRQCELYKLLGLLAFKMLRFPATLFFLLSANDLEGDTTPQGTTVVPTLAVIMSQDPCGSSEIRMKTCDFTYTDWCWKVIQ
jgi:hypothetical protein